MSLAGAPTARTEARPAPCAKGLLFHGARDYYDLVVPGGSAAVFAALAKRKPELETWLATPKLPGGWYDVRPIVPMSHTAAGLVGVPHAQLVRDNAAWLARRDLRGVYRFLLRLASVDLVAASLPGLSLRYFDFGHAEGTMIAPRVFESTRRGIPEALIEWFQWAIEGFTPVALEMAGARGVEVVAVAAIRAGMRGELRVRVSWS